MQTPQEIQIPVPWGHIAGKSWGDVNDEKMIAVHGMQDNCGVFDRLIPLLKGNYYIVAIDLPGHGFSSPFSPGFPINFLDYITAMKHVIQYLRWEKFYYLGHSLGGMIGTFFIALYPHHVLKFCLLDHFGPEFVADHLYLSKLRERMAHYFKEYNRIKDRVRPAYTYEEALSKLMNRESYLTKEAAEIVLKRSARNNKEGVSFIMDQRLKLPNIPFPFSFMKEIVLNINCPTLIVLSSQRLERYKSIFKEIIPIYESSSNVIIKHIEGGHDFHQNNPENLVDIIDNFFILKKSRTYGNEKSPSCVLMIHGILDNCGSFERLIPMLKGDYYIVTIDLPSHGLSSHFPAGLPLEFLNFVLAIKRVVDYFNWTKFIYIGHSFGGQLGTYFTALYSEYIIKLIVLDTMGPRQVKLHETFHHFKQILNKQMELEKKLSNNKIPIYSLESAMHRLMNNRPSKLTKESASILIQRMIKKQNDGYVFTFDQRLKNPPVPTLQFDQQKEIMTNINCPVLYILADENLLRYDTYLKEIFEFNKMKENCEIVQVKGDHCVHQNYPERVSHHIDRFIT